MKVTRRNSPGRQEIVMSFTSYDEVNTLLAELDRQALANRRGVEAPPEPIRTTAAWVGEPQAEIEAAET